MNNYKIKIIHLYPNLLNLYGDKGNISALLRRLQWRGITAELDIITGEEEIDFSSADIVFLGGGTEREVKLVLEKLMPRKEELKAFTESGKTVLAVCEGFEMLGKYFYMNENKLSGLDVLNICSEQAQSNKRILGDAVIESDGGVNIVGFENHSGRMNIGDYKALGKVIKGEGNDGKSGYEGLRYKNVFATYLHGPLLPKNPKLCDIILDVTLKNKYSDFCKLEDLDDTIENMANNYIVKRLGV